MTNIPSTHEQLHKEFTDILKPFKAEKISGKCADIVIRERMKILTNTVNHVESMVDRVTKRSDKSTGEWMSHNPHDPKNRPVD